MQNEYLAGRRANTEAADLAAKAGEAVLVNRSVEGLRAILSVEELRKAAAVSRAAVYRHLPEDHRVERVGAWIADFERSGVRKATRVVMRQYRADHRSQDSEEARETQLASLLALNVTMQFATPKVAAGWILHTLASPYSAAFQRALKPGPDADLARRLLEQRRAFYDEMSLVFEGVLIFGMRSLNRRPASGSTLRQVVVAMHSAHDGLVLRRMIDPAITPEWAGRVVLGVALALTEPGALTLPRQPAEGTDDHVRYSALIDAALRAFDRGRVPTLLPTTRSARVSRASARRLFDSDAALHDAVARSLVPADPLIDALADELPIESLRTFLDQMAEAVDAHAAVFDALSRAPASPPSFRSDVERHVERALRTAGVPKSERHARALVQYALDGHRGRAGVAALLDALEEEVDL